MVRAAFVLRMDRLLSRSLLQECYARLAALTYLRRAAAAAAAKYALRGSIQYDTQYSTVQYSTIQFRTVQLYLDINASSDNR